MTLGRREVSLLHFDQSAEVALYFTQIFDFILGRFADLGDLFVCLELPQASHLRKLMVYFLHQEARRRFVMVRRSFLFEDRQFALLNFPKDVRGLLSNMLWGSFNPRIHACFLDVLFNKLV